MWPASLDASIFSATPASAVRSAGILNGIASLTATPSTAGTEASLRGDLAKVGGAVAAATGSANLAFVVSPGYALRLLTYRNVIGDAAQIWPSIAVPDGTIICVAVDAFVSGFGPVPRIETSRDAVVHMEADAPLPIASPGSPNVVAAPTRSLFQTDSIAVRCILDAAWCLRSPAAVAWITGALW